MIHVARLRKYIYIQNFIERRGRVVNTPASHREVSGSNIGPVTVYPDWGSRRFRQSLQAYAEIVP
jgi:hypothetical protein